jgi:hypothetical protein
MPVAPSAGIHPSYLTWLGFQHESAYGTPGFAATGGAITNVLPLDASTFDPEDKPVWLRDIGIRGSMADVFAIIQGVEDAAWSLGGPAYYGLTPMLLDNMFGDITTTPVGGTAAGALTLATAYVAGTTGTTLALSGAASSFTAGVVGVITTVTGPTYTEYFTAVSNSVDNVVITNPLHFNFPVGSTVKVFTPGGTGIYAHKFAALNAGSGQPPTYTLLDSTGVVDATPTNTYGQRVYTSMCLAQLDFTISAESLFTQKASGTSWASTPTAAAPLSASAAFTPGAQTALPIPSWSSQIKLNLPVAGGLQAVNYVGEVTFSLKRKLQVYWTDDGVQSPYIIARGPLQVTGTVKAVVAQDEEILTSMLQNFQGSLQAAVIFPTGTGPAFSSAALQANTATSGPTGTAFLFHVNQAAFTAAKPTRSSVLVGYDSTFEGVSNTTDVGQTGGLGPITITAVDLNPGY